jgi:septum formation protein
MHHASRPVVYLAGQLSYSPIQIKPVTHLEKLNQFEIILGSASPRRRFLLGELGLKFESLGNHDMEESYPDHLQAEEIPLYLAKLKARSYASLLKEKTILITADTIVWLNQEVIGKPRDKEDAIAMLHQLSGKMHYVYTGVCLTTISKETSFTAESKVFFRELTTEEIDYYVNRFNPVDKAGAYGIQEWIGYIGVERIEGSYFNVMGLPVQKLYNTLIHFIE